MGCLHLTADSGNVSREGESLVFRGEGGEKQTIPLVGIEGVFVHGSVTLTTPVLCLLMERGVRVHYLGGNGRYIGSAGPAARGQIRVQAAQMEASVDPVWKNLFAQSFVVGKILNQYAVLMRFAEYRKGESGEIRKASARLHRMALNAAADETAEKAMGFEGAAASAYFGQFPNILIEPWSKAFKGRNRRPPEDPVNCLLSFGYALLQGKVAEACLEKGLDIETGFLHESYRSRPALALDLMEEFRPVAVDRLVLAVLNQSILPKNAFEEEGKNGLRLRSLARQRFIKEFEETMKKPVRDALTLKKMSMIEAITGQAEKLKAAVMERKPYFPLTCL
jgi:CRISPR-associated protein Cas1